MCPSTLPDRGVVTRNLEGFFHSSEILYIFHELKFNYRYQDIK